MRAIITAARRLPQRTNAAHDDIRDRGTRDPTTLTPRVETQLRSRQSTSNGGQPYPASEVAVPQRRPGRPGEHEGIRLGRYMADQIIADIGQDPGGTMTVRLPASVLGGPNVRDWPLTSVSWRATGTVPASVSMSRPRSAARRPDSPCPLRVRLQTDCCERCHQLKRRGVA